MSIQTPPEPGPKSAPVSAPDPSLPPPGLLTNLPIGVRWMLLLVASAALATLLELARLPAALMLGAMGTGILMGVNGARMSVPQLPFIGAQAVIACLVASAINPGIIDTFAAEWQIFIGVVVTIILATGIMGYFMGRTDILPGTTAVWGTSAGAATAMVIMAEENGGDPRLVAFMQYLRMVAVAVTASLIAAYVFNANSSATREIVWFPPVDWPALAKMLAVALASSAVGRLTGIPSATLLLPAIVTSVLHATGMLAIELPTWLLAAAYAVVGWRFGLGFTRRILWHGASALPQIAASIVVLIVFCAGLAWLLHKLLGIDPLTAYLATSPGGLDVIAIIAASTPVDLSFVMALQAVRFIMIMLFGPLISRFIAERLPAK